MTNNNQSRILKEAIVRAIVFFDLFDCPLSLYELWQYLEQPATLAELSDILREGIEGVESFNGFYFLRSRQEIILERQKRYNFSLVKVKLAHHAARLFRFVPFIKMIAVSNIIGAHNLRDGSDIDLFIVASPRRLWLTRFFCAGLAKILGWRPTKEVKRNRICLSFYVSSEALNLQELKLSAADLYFNYWLAGLVPVYDRNQTYAQLIAENAWLKECLPNWQERQVKSTITQGRGWKLLSTYLDRWERRTLKWQLKIMPQALRDLINVDTRVRANEKIIKLYLVDRRREFLDKFSYRLGQVLNK